MRGALPTAAIGIALACGSAFAQASVDPDLARVIDATRAIDNHAHPSRCTDPAGPPDAEVDQIPLDALTETRLPASFDPGGRDSRAASHALYGVAETASDAEVLAARRRALDEHGERYAAWILDRVGVDTMLANRIALGPCLTEPRFRFVPFVDALIFPLRNAGLARENPDVAGSLRGTEALLGRYLREAGVAALPRDLAGYLARVVTPTLERLRKQGAVAVKFEAAYIRPLHFENVAEAEASAVYARFVAGGEPPAADYRRLQDFLFHATAREAGRLGLAVHAHVLGVGAGSYYAGARSDPWLLESLFDEPELRATRFVLVHGGWPATDAVASLLLKPNVYADFSAQTFILTPPALARVLRTWLAFAPDKVLFGTDALPFAPTLGWEEAAWLLTRNARRALGLALTGMLADGEIDRAQAERLAVQVLRGNAERLYAFDAASGKKAGGKP